MGKIICVELSELNIHIKAMSLSNQLMKLMNLHRTGSWERCTRKNVHVQDFVFKVFDIFDWHILQASDDDEGENAEIVYTIISGNTTLFSVGHTSGILHTISSPSNAGAEMLVISASNSVPYASSALRDSTVMITVNILVS